MANVTKIIYILSDNRSGSTLLDQLLGAHDNVISIGEIHHLPAYARQDRSAYDPVHPLRCYCGERLNDCLFWQRVQAHCGKPFGELVLKPRFFEWPVANPSLVQRVRNRVRGYVARRPHLALRPSVVSLLNGPRLAADSFRLFDAIFREAETDFLIDSSKSPFRFRLLFNAKPDRMLAILLGRDYRGTVHSYMKRGESLEHSARNWRSRMEQMAQLTADLPKEQLIRLRYEDLCADPRKELTRLCSFLGIDFDDKLLSRPSVESHHIGGSPSKFDPDRKEIRLDQSYLSAFSEQDLFRMRDIVGEIAVEWGYD